MLSKISKKMCAPLFNGSCGSFPPGQSSRDVKPTTHFHLGTSLRIRWGIGLYGASLCTKKCVPFLCILVRVKVASWHAYAGTKGRPRHSYNVITVCQQHPSGIHCTEGWVRLEVGLSGKGKARPHRFSIPGPASPWRVAIPTEQSLQFYLGKMRCMARWSGSSTVTAISWYSCFVVDHEVGI
jgi:hypothetical protein